MYIWCLFGIWYGLVTYMHTYLMLLSRNIDHLRCRPAFCDGSIVNTLQPLSVAFVLLIPSTYHSSLSIMIQELCGHLRTRRSSLVSLTTMTPNTATTNTATTTTTMTMTTTRPTTRTMRGRRIFSSVSSSEVGKFSALSKTWWDPTHNPLIGMNSIRMQYIQQQVWERRPTTNDPQSQSPPLPSSSSSLPLSGLKVLDVGCGGGLLSESLARLGAHVTAIDPSTDLVDAARFHSQLDPRTRQIDFRGGMSVEDLAATTRPNEQDEQYDIICLLEVLEHVTDPTSMVSSIHSLLKPKGLFFLSTLNRTVKSKVLAIWGAEYVMGYLPVGTHDWNQFRSPDHVHTLLSSKGFHPVHVTGMVLKSPPLWGHWDWKLDESDMDMNWIGTYQKKVSEDDNTQ